MGALGGEESAAPEVINAGEERIMVSVRMRPLNAKEIARNDVSDWECISENTVILKNNFAAERSMWPNAYTFGEESSLSIYLSIFLCFCFTPMSEN